MATSTCQICLDSIEDGPDNSLFTQICSETCSARVCRQCFTQHLNVTMKQFYPGILPRVRCPICLVPMNKSLWEYRYYKPPVNGTVFRAVTKYNDLCEQACSVTPPCCHKADYTHLPLHQVGRTATHPIKLLPSQVEKYKALCVEFCRHKLEPRTVLDYAFDTFGEEKAMTLVNELTLSRITDPERRATLLLSLMYFRPNTKTNCCGADFCFNCKRAGHHETCPEEFNEDNDLVRCRKCRVLLLKVAGCDSVNCVCGFNMNWGSEQRLRQDRKRNLLPIDIFDVKLTDAWLDFRRLQAPILTKLPLQKCVITCRPLLRRHFAVRVWRFRLRKILVNELGEECQAMRAKVVDQHIASVKSILRAAVGAYIWRRRFSQVLVTAQHELYWKAYHRWHPEELEADADEANEFFNINVYEDDE